MLRLMHNKVCIFLWRVRTCENWKIGNLKSRRFRKTTQGIYHLWKVCLRRPWKKEFRPPGNLSNLQRRHLIGYRRQLQLFHHKSENTQDRDWAQLPMVSFYWNSSSTSRSLSSPPSSSTQEEIHQTTTGTGLFCTTYMYLPQIWLLRTTFEKRSLSKLPSKTRIAPWPIDHS